MRIIAVIVLALALSGCAATRLTKEGETVTVLNDRTNLPTGAVFIKSTQGEWGSLYSTRQILNYARNWGADLGADYVVVDITPSPNGNYGSNLLTKIDAYRR